MGFLTNAGDRQGLAHSQRQMLTATAIANAIEEYKNAVAPKTPRAATN
jgi:N-acetylmuramoyl-L-alanine amidase